MFQVGQHVTITKPVSFHDGGAAAQIANELPAGTTGTVADIGDNLNAWVIVHLDQTFPCLNEWENSVTFDQDVDGEMGVGIAAECLGLCIADRSTLGDIDRQTDMCRKRHTFDRWYVVIAVPTHDGRPYPHFANVVQN